MEPTRVDQILAVKPRAAKIAQATFFASFLGAAKKEGPSGRDMERFWWQSHQRVPQRQRRSLIFSSSTKKSRPPMGGQHYSYFLKGNAARSDAHAV